MTHLLAILLAAILEAAGAFIVERRSCRSSAIHAAMITWMDVMSSEMLVFTIYVILKLRDVLK